MALSQCVIAMLVVAGVAVQPEAPVRRHREAAVVASNTTGVEWCRKGRQATWDNPNEVWKCCDKACNQCGGPGCAQEGANCCHQTITAPCQDDKSTGCVIPQEGAWGHRWCKKGVGLTYDSARGKVWKCCDAGCSKCGGPTCAQEGGTCCHQHISTPCSDETSTACQVSSSTAAEMETVCRVNQQDNTYNGQGTTCPPNNVCPKGHTMASCKASCAARADCTGFEFKLNNGRCEVWTRKIGYQRPQPGFKCVVRNGW